MKGKVIAAREAIVAVVVLDEEGTGWEIDAAVDTAAIGELTLPPEAINQLNLTWARSDVANIAGDRLVECEVYTATIVWCGDTRKVEVFEVESDALIGMGLLEGHRLTLDVVDGGDVEIVPLTMS